MKLKESREDLVSFGQTALLKRLLELRQDMPHKVILGCLSDLSTRISRSHSWVVIRR
jgi:hypothetical protein